MTGKYDIAKLNRDYAVKGRIAFREGPCDEPVIVLAENHGACEVSLYGGHVLSYRPVGYFPVLWLSPSAAECRQGKAIRGGIPVCWPWFGAAGFTAPDGSALPAHGFARTQAWNLLRTDYDSYSTSATLLLTDSPETRALWPGKFRLELKVTIGANLTLELKTFNEGTSDFEITEALHTYFRVKDIGGVAVAGLDSREYIDKVSGAESVRQSGDITFSSETDRIYSDTSEKCFLNDTSLGRRIEIAKSGSSSTVVWNPWIEKSKTMKDMPEDSYKSFVCVETANAAAEKIVIPAGGTHTMTLSISSSFIEDSRK